MNNYLEKMILAYMNEEIAYSKLVDYCYALEINTKNKTEIINCIFSFDLELLYRLLLTDFNKLLTREEIMYFTDKYNSLFDSEWVEND